MIIQNETKMNLAEGRITISFIHNTACESDQHGMRRVMWIYTEIGNKQLGYENSIR